jgi:hypothetical protein
MRLKVERLNSEKHEQVAHCATNLNYVHFYYRMSEIIFSRKYFSQISTLSSITISKILYGHITLCDIYRLSEFGTILRFIAEVFNTLTPELNPFAQRCLT